MSEGLSLKELHKFFEYIEQAMKDNKLTVVIDNEMCRFLYTYLKELSSYNDMQDKQIDQLTNNWNELEKYIIEQETINNGAMKCSLSSDSEIKQMGIENDIYDLILDKMKEIKEGK